MASTYSPNDLDTDRNKVRFLIPDTNTAGDHALEDEEIDVCLSMEGNNVKLSAALALETIAGNEALKLKVLTVGDIKTDGADLGNFLLKKAAGLRKQAADAKAETDKAVGLPFATAEIGHGIFGIDAVLANQRLRDAL